MDSGCGGPDWPFMAVFSLLALVGAAALIVVVRASVDKLAAGHEPSGDPTG